MGSASVADRPGSAPVRHVGERQYVASVADHPQLVTLLGGAGTPAREVVTAVAPAARVVEAVDPEKLGWREKIPFLLRQAQHERNFFGSPKE